MIASTPRPTTFSANSTESAVQLSPAFAMIGARPADGLDDRLEELDLLRVEDRGRLARRAADDERVAALVEKLEGEFLRARQVEFEVGGERGHHGRDHPAETRRRHERVPPGMYAGHVTRSLECGTHSIPRTRSSTGRGRKRTSLCHTAPTLDLTARRRHRGVRSLSGAAIPQLESVVQGLYGRCRVVFGERVPRSWCGCRRSGERAPPERRGTRQRVPSRRAPRACRRRRA